MMHTDEAHRNVSDFVSEANPRSPIEVHVRIGEPKEQILNEVNILRPSQMFMLGHIHSDLERVLVGSVTESVLHQTDCSMYVHRDEEKSWDNSFMVAVGQTDVNKRVVEVAGQWAMQQGAALHLVTVLPPLQIPYAPDVSGAVAQETPEQLEQRIRERRDLLEHYAKILVHADVHTVCSVELNAAGYLGLQNYQEQHRQRLLFIAAHKHTTLGRLFLGSNTDYLLHNLNCPMFIYKDPPEPQS
jgi:nucleotide-binding universal stress UspA family protein